MYRRSFEEELYIYKHDWIIWRPDKFLRFIPRLYSVVVWTLSFQGIILIQIMIKYSILFEKGVLQGNAECYLMLLCIKNNIMKTEIHKPGYY